MTRDDLKDVVDLHVLCFPHYFLTGLGDGVLRHYYTYAMDDPQSLVIVLEIPESGRVVGLAVGTFDPEFQAKLFLSHLFGFLWGVLRGVFMSHTVREGIVQRLWDMKWAVRSLFRATINHVTADPQTASPLITDYACLLVNAVHPEWRGWQSSERFLKYFTNCVLEMGATGIWGTVYPENLAALILYKRLSWNIEKQGPKRVMVWLDLM
ncbi:MAG: hypothetical protein SWH78_01220 [Thermodesulfobacteriota bacterium]|nr:hypothetical protein [Thermodesulfobacteriota bacterium]